MLKLLLLGLILAQAPGAGGQLDQARSAVERQDYQTALRILQQVVQAEPKNAEAFYLAGVALSAVGNLQGAETSFAKSVQESPSMVLGYVGLSDVYLRLKRDSDAVRILENALKILPGDPLLQFELGKLSARAGNFDQALRYLESIPAADAPPGFWETLGRTYLSAGRIGEARRAYSELLKGNPHSVKTLQTLSALALKQGQLEDAWHYIAQARTEAPNSAQVIYAFAAVSLERKLVTEAIAALRLLLLRDPDNPEYLMMLGNAVLESATEFPKSVRYFERYVELKPEDPLGHMLLGYARYGNMEYEGAKQELNWVLQNRPESFEAVYYLGMIDLNENRVDEAQRRFEQVLASSETHADAHQSLGKILLRKGQFEQAIQELRRAEELGGGSSDIYFNLSRAYAQLGDRSEAERVLELYQEFKTREAEQEEVGRERPFFQLQRPDGP